MGRIKMKYVLSLIFFSLLTSCQTTAVSKSSHKLTMKPASHRFTSNVRYRKDSAPSGPIPTRFQKVKPKNEPMSRYGNPGAYKVGGRTYDVMTSAHGYRARGLASWYGTKFHSQRTSSGENYDMYSLTAAHRTLPLPSYVRVKNLDNGRQAIVKINDRGPFHSDRIIDLSYGAAAKLGILPKGTANVEIEAIATTKSPRVAKYYLQTGAFKSAQFARIMQSKLSKMGAKPVFVEKYKGHFIVRIGPLTDKNSSERLKRDLARRGIKGVYTLLM